MNPSHYDVAIVGAGWLGEALAHSWQDDSTTVIATCRAQEKRKRLEEDSITTVLYQLGDDVHSENLAPLWQAEILVLNIAPGKMKQNIDHFITSMKRLIDQFMQVSSTESKQSHIIFISTTSVYGEATRTVLEESPVEPTTVSARAHVEIEQYLHERYRGQTTVLRLAGLVGKDRHPVRHLVRKSPLSLANKRVNLIVREDVITGIKAINNKRVWGETLHLCCHEHPSRQDYYTWAAEKLGLPKPEFTDEGADDIGKIIQSDWTCERLGLTLRYASPYDILT